MREFWFAWGALDSSGMIEMYAIDDVCVYSDMLARLKAIRGLVFGGLSKNYKGRKNKAMIEKKGFIKKDI